MDLDKLIKLYEKQFEIKDSKKIKENIEKYKAFLQSENKKYNLTRLDKNEIVYQQYFYESTINFSLKNFENVTNVLDIGSGSGIPGIVLKILFPHINLYIVESNNKKCKFLDELVKILNLNNVYISNKRCEDYIKNKRNFFDLITCRAVAEIRIILELAIPGLKINGSCFLLKSANYLNELNDAKYIAKKLNLNDPEINVINQFDKTFVGINYIKTKEVDSIFPRSWKEILSNDKN